MVSNEKSNNENFVLSCNTIVHCDCINGMRYIPDNYFDYAFTSPPYNRKRNDKYKLYDDTLDDYYGFLIKLTEELRRITKNHIFLNVQTNYYNKSDVYRFIGTYADYIQNIIVWEKTNPMPASGTNVTNAFEYFIVIGDKPLKALHTYTKNIISTSVNSKTTSKKHKAVMNREVAEWIFDSFIPAGSFVIDPMMGLGTTAIVANNHDCKWFGFEIIQDYIDIALMRIKEQNVAN